MNDSSTLALASYAADLTYSRIPKDVVETLKLHVLDAVGAALYGFNTPWARIIRDVAVAAGGKAEAAVWNTSVRLPAAQAAFVNSTATHAFELDDRRVASYMHPASAALPAALATADSLGGVEGRDLITAMVAGYEVGLRVGKAIGFGSTLRGFYPPGIGGSFTAAITAAKLRGMDAGTICYALDLTASQAAGLYNATMMKRFNLGRGTFNGMLAIELTEAGFRGMQDPFEREAGNFCKAYADQPDFKQLTSGLGSEFETSKVELKPYVSSRPNHTAIDATLQLHRENPNVTPEEIRKIEIEVGSANYIYGAGFEIRDVPNALMSVAYCAAVALLDGDAFLEQFTSERLADLRCRQLLEKTTVTADPKVDALGLEGRDHATVRWTLPNGRVVEAARTFAKGHPSDALTPSEVRAKFHRLADKCLPNGKTRELEEAFLQLERIDSTRVGKLLEHKA